MTEPSSGAAGSDWVIPPPAPGEVNLYVSVDPEAQLTPELQAALESLLRLVAQEESVQGYKKSDDPNTPDCRRFTISNPCAYHVVCKIKDILTR